MSSGICKVFCKQYKAKRPKDRDRYGNGQKYCAVCSLYIKWGGKHCPCCNTNLRTRSRGKQNQASTYKVRIP